jgi:ribosomal protein S18 acetylase RimI-like enzyme
MRLENFDTLEEKVLQSIDDGLEKHNFAAAPLQDVRPLATVARGEDEVPIGGAVGRTWGKCCELLQLWVDEAHRGKGIGSKLLHEFEAQGRSRGCSTFYLTTLSYQAPEFYRRHGYETLASIDGYPEGIVKYLMLRKEA